MIFLTVGAQFGFDRLVKAVDMCVEKGVIKDDLFAQVGNGRYIPRNFPFKPLLNSKQYGEQFANASAVIGHAGMGTIITALKMNKPLLAMPRLKEFGEVVNDHQIAICRRFAAEGLLLPAYSETELPERVVNLAEFVPLKREPQPEKVFDRIREFLKELDRGL
ncbi:hypothetical protein STSP2_02650 [Anaerohalosphaera lusitana]|uniref:Glycosyl transferase family 28 C-terminal domain-containing protein n=1 Tax=Anaerohalosphaera lusitana TaxID=1936003 RepID=A0A1U9NPC7_9BACT|nr:glycosyltransferase [Anaerohalosphaera lusitana]AQT69460.1 hypothetical protein STSP2_02650 [Anaerohalosphaera lusitana]